MIGYEINPIVGNQTRKNLARYKNIEIISNNIFNDFPNSVNLFYLFNPFSEEMMNDFKESIWNIRYNNPTILYYNPKFIQVFDDSRFTYSKTEISPLQWGLQFELAIIRIR
ncbi:MAG: hypothetical protein CK547_03320 [Chitinophagaceae bacterium]|nr:MAG: hypothetical protein CK547_03320 [Chitinophagaceae bacterium]